MGKFNSPFMVLRSVGQSLRRHPQIFIPLVLIAFLNLLALELLYFAPRYPLSILFDPFIRRIWGEKYLHYPMDLVLLPKTFYYAQLMIGLFVSNFLSAVMVHMIAACNNDERINVTHSARRCVRRYIHIVAASFVALAMFIAANWLYGFIIARAQKLQATTGGLFLLKKVITLGVPYAQLFFDVLVSILLVYTLPVIVVEGKKVFQAIAASLRLVAGSFWVSAAFVFVPTLFYFPVLIMRNNIDALVNLTAPGIQVVVIAVGIVTSIAINGVIVIAATTYYLYKKESA